MKTTFRKIMPNTVARRNPVAISSALNGYVGTRLPKNHKAYARHGRHRRRLEEQT
jgi:hypothetical protein